jgi:hypothetical protein
MKAIRDEFLAKEASLYAEIDQLSDLVPESEIKFMNNYLKEFFDVLKDDSRFNYNILSACRTTE